MASMTQSRPEVKPLIETIQRAVYGEKSILDYDECVRLENAERLAIHWQQRARRERTRFASRMAREMTAEALELAAELSQQTVVQAWTEGAEVTA